MSRKTKPIDEMNDEREHEPEGGDSPAQEAGSDEARDREDEVDEVDQVDPLTRERDEMRDRLLRKTAEFDNYRKRVDKERRELSQWAAADVLTDLVALLDDFDRALAADAPTEAEPYRAGVELIHRQLGELLRKRGVTTIEALGKDFDPNLHQAVAYEETPGAREGEVIGEMRKGYRLGERLLRPALVRVAKAS